MSEEPRASPLAAARQSPPLRRIRQAHWFAVSASGHAEWPMPDAWRHLHGPTDGRGHCALHRCTDEARPAECSSAGTSNAARAGAIGQRGATSAAG